MNVVDYLNYAMAVTVAHKYLLISAVALFECVLVVSMVYKTVLLVSGPDAQHFPVEAHAPNALRNAVIMGTAVIFLLLSEMTWSLYGVDKAFTTPIEWSITAGALITTVLINVGAWFTLFKITRSKKRRSA